MRKWLGATCLLAATAAALPAQAQTVDIQRAEENLRPVSEPVPAKVPAPMVAPQAAPADAAQIKFKLRGLQIDGATTLSDATLRGLWRHWPEEEISVADIFAYAEAITKAYADAGYALSFAIVPQQEIVDGVVTVRVIEGFVEQVGYTGDTLPKGLFGRRRTPVEAQVAPILSERPLTTETLERKLLLVNDTPGLAARATFSPSPTTLGGSVLNLDVNRRRISGEIGYNSYMPASLDRDVVGGSLAFNSLVTGADGLRIGGWHSLFSDAYWSLSGEYTTQLGADGMSLSTSAFYSRARPVSPVLTAIDYAGDAFNASVMLRYPLIRSRLENLSIEGGVSMLDTDATYVAGSLLHDRLRVAELALSYNATDAGQGATAVRIEFSQGLDLPGTGGNSRAFGTNDFTTLGLSFQRLQPLLARPEGSLSLLISGLTQTSLGGPLFSGVECSYGGRRFGRGFDSGEASGEHCALGSAELRWSTKTTALSQTVAFQVYGFADGGVIRQSGSLVPGEKRDQRLASAGTGLRVELGNGLSGTFELSRSLHRPANWPTDGATRATGSVSVRF